VKRSLFNFWSALHLLLGGPFLFLPLAMAHAAPDWTALSPEQRVADVKLRRREAVSASLKVAGLTLGSPVFLRIMKEDNEMEVWLKSDTTSYKHWQTFPIARWSGTLGPKLAEGDGQAPEGVYDITRARLHPGSKYHLAFNIGYPNAFDRAHDRTGSLIMIHGSNVSIGCFAMTDPVIEDLYLIVDAAIAKGQTSVPVHSFPFRMTDARLAAAKAEASEWLSFWEDLSVIWQAFEKTHIPPAVIVSDQRYHLPPPP
jgi:murein L,D-transpeptidase YafK